MKTVFLSAIIFFLAFAAEAAPAPALCPNQQVITLSGLSGTVVGVYQDGSISVRFPNGEDNRWPRNELAVLSGCSGQYCVGKKVIDSLGNEGQIIAIFSDGDVAVDSNAYNGYYPKWKTINLALMDICTDNQNCTH